MLHERHGLHGLHPRYFFRPSDIFRTRSYSNPACDGSTHEGFAAPTDGGSLSIQAEFRAPSAHALEGQACRRQEDLSQEDPCEEDPSQEDFFEEDPSQKGHSYR
jgi:hypothetical protein